MILSSVSLVLPHKTCFDDFCITIPEGSRIAIMGRNGSGKSSLLRFIKGEKNLVEGSLKKSTETVIGYVPQTVVDHDCLSGGQRFNEALTQALAEGPDILLLDEPTNHLDARNRKSLLRMLQNFPGTLIIVTHDVAVLRLMEMLWHIDQGKISVFKGNYDDYRQEQLSQRQSLEEDLRQLKHQKKQAHQSLMKEQERAKSSRNRGEKSIDQRKWPTVVSHAKARRAEETSGRKSAEISAHKQDVLDQLADNRLAPILVPKFSITTDEVKDRVLLTIINGSVGYAHPIVHDIHITLKGGERLAIIGDNGSGKSTVVKGILGNSQVVKTGDWHVPNLQDIGYLDQHYSTLDPDKTVLQSVQEVRPDWLHADLRAHLNDFLFRKNEEVNAFVSTLSGGEKARLSLALIAAKTPKLLILDEVTNNLDLEACEHMIQVLNAYPGALIVISHDEHFLTAIGVEQSYKLTYS